MLFPQLIATAIAAAEMAFLGQAEIAVDPTMEVINQGWYK
jgi:hypothetical protein